MKRLNHLLGTYEVQPKTGARCDCNELNNDILVGYVVYLSNNSTQLSYILYTDQRLDVDMVIEN